MSSRDPLDQLTALRVEPDGETRARHLDAIRTELRRRSPARTNPRRRWTVGVVVAVLLAGPAAAIASDGAVPGDLLYPVKRAVEPIVQLFDRNVAAEHRVEEVAVLVDRDTENRIIEERIDVARAALAETDSPRLREELDAIVDRWVADRSQATDAVPNTTAPPRDEPEREPDRRDSDEPGDRPTETTVDGSPGRVPDTTSTTVAQSGDDRPADDRPAEGRPAEERPRDTP